MYPDISSNPRAVIVVQPAGHHIWTLQTKDELRQYLQENFPQLNGTEWFNDEVQCPLDVITSGVQCQRLFVQALERFVKSRGGVYTDPQYTTGMQQLYLNESGGLSSAVLLAGDAVHSFPPDIGQGINCAFEGIYALHSALRQHGEDLQKGLRSFILFELLPNQICYKLRTALPQYEAVRAVEAAALCR